MSDPKNPMTMNVPLERREITSPKEKELVRVENELRYEEARKETEAEAAATPQFDPDPHAPEADPIIPDTIFGWMRLVKQAFPNMRETFIQIEAKRLMKRSPLLIAAVKAGLRQGRDLRQREEHSVGWWWEELEPLTPTEREQVLRVVRSNLHRG